MHAGSVRRSGPAYNPPPLHAWQPSRYTTAAAGVAGSDPTPLRRINTACGVPPSPSQVAYVVDTPRCASPQTFMSNMLQACSILYKTKLPMLLVRGGGGKTRCVSVCYLLPVLLGPSP